MADYTIVDEGTRTALECALWLRAHLDIWEDGLSNDLWGAGSHRARNETAEADRRERNVIETLEMLTVLRDRVGQVRPLGSENRCPSTCPTLISARRSTTAGRPCKRTATSGRAPKRIDVGCWRLATLRTAC
jgi:hypothetical protein